LISPTVDAELLRVPEVRDHRRALQQRLGGDAPDVQADAAEELVLHATRLYPSCAALIAAT
jgi:hypothetical protein